MGAESVSWISVEGFNVTTEGGATSGWSKDEEIIYCTKPKQYVFLWNQKVEWICFSFNRSPLLVAELKISKSQNLKNLKSAQLINITKSNIKN